MKVLHITNMYPNDDKPWYGVFIADQINSLNKYIENDVFFIDGNKSKFNYFKSLLELRKIKKEYDIIHCHHGWCGIIALLSFKNHNNIFVSLVGGDLLEKKIFFKRIIAKILWSLLPKFKYVIGKSPEMVEICKKRTSSVGYVPNGVNLNMFKELNKDNCKQRLNLDLEKKYFLFTAAKNDKNRTEKRYDIIEGASKELSSRGIYNFEILFLSNVSHEMVPLYLNSCEAVLLASDYEGSPNIIKEAMACNVPIISTAVGNVPDMIEELENCYIAEQNSGNFADIMEIFINSEENKRCEGRSRLKDIKLDENSVAENIYETYRRVNNRNE
ncbi:glycosyltransferase [Peribacillus frigoritolerans]